VLWQCCRHANHSALGGIIPHFRRFSAILRGICEILRFHSIHLSHKNLVFSCINLQKNPITRGHLWSSNCTIIKIGWGFAPDPSGRAYSAPPRPLAGFHFIGHSGLHCWASIVGPSGLHCDWFLFLVFKCWHVWCLLDCGYSIPRKKAPPVLTKKDILGEVLNLA